MKFENYVNEINTKKKIKLIMNKDEAIWLKNILQNPFHANESLQDKNMRIAFWRALGRQLR